MRPGAARGAGEPALPLRAWTGMPVLRLAVLLFLLLAPGMAGAQDVITVGVVERPPFAMLESGTYSGAAVDLWRMIAERMGLSYELVPVPPGGALEALRGGADLVLPVDVSTGMSAAADLTQPFHIGPLGIAETGSPRLLSVVSGLLTLEFARLIGALSVLLLVVGAAVWAVERRSNDEMFNRTPLRGLGDGFWWAGVTLTTIGYGDKAPATFAGRAIAMVWMLVGLAVSAALTAALVTIAGGQSGEARMPRTVEDRSVAVADGSAAAGYLAIEGVPATRYEDALAALRAVADGRADVAVGAASVLSHVVAEEDLGLTVRPSVHDPVMMAIALPPGSALARPVNRALLGLVQSETGGDLMRRYLGGD